MALLTGCILICRGQSMIKAMARYCLQAFLTFLFICLPSLSQTTARAAGPFGLASNQSTNLIQTAPPIASTEGEPATVVGLVKQGNRLAREQKWVRPPRLTAALWPCDPATPPRTMI